MNYKEQLQNLAQKYIQNFAPGGVVGNPGFGTKITKQYKDENNREVVEFSDGKRMYTDSPEYQKLYSEGLLYGESPDKITYPQANANPEMERYKRIESENPFGEFVRPYFEGQSGAIARATGQSQDSLENMPEDYKKRYDESINKKWAEDVFNSNPQNEGETRGEYLNRIAQGMNPQVQKALYNNLPSSQQTTLWQDGDRGLRFAVEGLPGAGTAEEIISRDSSLSDYEKQLKLQNLRENPTMGRIEGNAEMFAPASVLPKLVQSTYRPNYSPMDALMGRKNDAGVIEDEVTDLSNYLGVGLGIKFIKGLSEVNSFGKKASTINKLGIESKVLDNSKNMEDLLYAKNIFGNRYNIPENLERISKSNVLTDRTIRGLVNRDNTFVRGVSTNWDEISKKNTNLKESLKEKGFDLNTDEGNRQAAEYMSTHIPPSTGYGRVSLTDDAHGLYTSNSIRTAEGYTYGDGYIVKAKRPTDFTSPNRRDWVDNNKVKYNEHRIPGTTTKDDITGYIFTKQDIKRSELTENHIGSENFKNWEIYHDNVDNLNKELVEKYRVNDLTKDGPYKLTEEDIELANGNIDNARRIKKENYNKYIKDYNESILSHKRTLYDNLKDWENDVLPEKILKTEHSDKNKYSHYIHIGEPDEKVLDVLSTKRITPDIYENKSRSHSNEYTRGLSTASLIPIGLGVNELTNVEQKQKGGTVSLKNELNNLAQKFQKGGQKPYSEKSYDEADIKDFYKKMVGSDWYKNRLIKNGYDDQYNIGVEGVLKKRMNRIDKAHLDNVQDDDGFNNQLYRFLTSGDFVKTGTGAYYNHDEDEITLVKSQMDRHGLHPRSVLAHEFGHAETGNSISNIEQEMLGKIRPDDELTTHNKSPFENKSDINTLRYNLYKNNLYDPSTGKFKTKSGLFESKLLKPVDTDFSTKRLRQHYGDKYLETLMNTIAQNDSEQTVSYAQVGGQTPPEDWKQKYSTNPYFKDREDWGDKLSNKFPNGTKSVKDVINTAAKQMGVDPGLLYTSSMEEGMKLALQGEDTGERRAGFKEFRNKNPKVAQQYPIDGGYFYGLNTFGDKYGKIIKPSSFPAGYKFQSYPQTDPKTGEVFYNSAAFRSHDDAIMAKAGMMRQVEDAMNARYKKNNINLSPEAQKFFSMVGYNMGEDKTIEMIKSYEQKGYLKNDKFLDANFQPASWKEPYTNVQRRYQNYKILNEQGHFPQLPNNNDQLAVTNKQSGGEVKNELQETKDWWTRYINSPKYLERLQKEFPDSSPEQVQKELEARKLNLDKTYPIVGPGNFKDEMKTAVGYVVTPEVDEKQYITLSSRLKNFMEDNVIPSSRPVYVKDATDSGTYNHEISHSVDEGGRRIPLKTIAKLVNKVRGVEPIRINDDNREVIYFDRPKDENTLNALENRDNYYPIDNDFDNSYGTVYRDIKWKIGNDSEEYTPKFGYRGSPSEIIARLQPLREDLYRKGAHDSATEDISKETLKKYIDEVYDNEDEPIPDHLLDLLNELKGNKEGILNNLEWMLNNIAKRDEKNKKPVVAQKGGNVGNSLKNQLNALAQKFQKA